MRRQWHWYVVQVATFCYVFWCITEITREARQSGQDFGHAPGMAAILAAFIVSYLLGKVVDLFSYLGRRLNAAISHKCEFGGNNRGLPAPRWHSRHNTKHIPGPGVGKQISDLRDTRS